MGFQVWCLGMNRLGGFRALPGRLFGLEFGVGGGRFGFRVCAFGADEAIDYLAVHVPGHDMRRHKVAFTQVGAGYGVVTFAVQFYNVLTHSVCLPSSG